MNLDSVKKTFFDRAAITDKLDPAMRKVFSKFGAFVRQRAKTSIRNAPKRKKNAKPGQKQKARVSLPGKPPLSHTGTLKKFIFFSYDTEEKTVVIGPTLAGSSSGAPQVLEEGGTAVVRIRGEKPKAIRVEPRPYMQPAFTGAFSDLQKDLKDFIR